MGTLGAGETRESFGYTRLKIPGIKNALEKKLLPKVENLNKVVIFHLSDTIIRSNV